MRVIRGVFGMVHKWKKLKIMDHGYRNFVLMSQFPWVLMIATTITKQQETQSGVMGGTPLHNRRDRQLHSMTKSLHLSPQRS